MVKKLLIMFLLMFLLISCVLAYLLDYPTDVTFSCSKQENICTYSSSTYIFKRKMVETIEFDKIIKSCVEENFSTKQEDISRYSGSTHYYYYDWIINYKNNGKIDKLTVFRTSDYKFSPAYELLDEEYRYYLDTAKVFNSFLKDNDKYSIYIPEYSDNSAKKRDFWECIFTSSFILTQFIIFIYIIIIGLSLEFLIDCLPEGKIKQILTCISEKLL